MVLLCLCLAGISTRLAAPPSGLDTAKDLQTHQGPLATLEITESLKHLGVGLGVTPHPTPPAPRLLQLAGSEGSLWGPEILLAALSQQYPPWTLS